MGAGPTKLGIVGLGRWAKVLARARASRTSWKSSRASAAPRRNAPPSRRNSACPRAGLEDPARRSLDQRRHPHRSQRAASAARARSRPGRQARLHREADRQHARGRPRIAALEKPHGVTVTVGHSARLMAGIRTIREAIDAGELGRVALHGGEFLQRARARAHAQDLALVQGPRRPADRCRSSRSTSSTCCTISAARSPRRARWPPSSRRSAPRSTTSR